ncbi:MAG: hypothetical protein RLZZ271_1391 [Pseudomonadota bacterium]|jgi:branched-chain amino acid transport system ATP-binding protein
MSAAMNPVVNAVVNAVEKAPLLEVRGLKVSYGGIEAVKGVDLAVYPGELVSLIGSNGAGKTTTMKALIGLLKPQSGEVHFKGQSIAQQGAWDLVKNGLVMVPEGRGVFARMSIEENLLMGAYPRSGASASKPALELDMERLFALFPRLKERRLQLAGTLSGGEQQMLAMARALMSQPQLLLLDEPSMGLSPLMVDKIFEVIRDVAAQGVTIMLVEQNATRALELASRAYVMDSGLISMSGNARDMLADPQVRAAYLGH